VPEALESAKEELESTLVMGDRAHRSPYLWRTPMRKKLVSLGFALAALITASTLAPAKASAATCPNGYHLIVCPTYSFCCPNNAFCVCSPFN
jgi:hypothetical protein